VINKRAVSQSLDQEFIISEFVSEPTVKFRSQIPANLGFRPG